MSDGVLSQEEIDALLKSSTFAELSGEDNQTQTEVQTPANDLSTLNFATSDLSDLEKDAVGEVANILMGSAATALSTLLGKKVEITTPAVQLTDPDKFRQDYPLPYLLVNVEYLTGIIGSNVLIIKHNDACVMADLIMGGDGQHPSAELNEMYLSAIGEAMNQMMGSSSTAISTIINERVEISPPTVETVNFATDELRGNLGTKGQTLIKVSFQMRIEELVDSEIMQLIPIDLAKSMVKNLMDEMTGYAAPADSSPVAIPDSQVAAAAEPAVIQQKTETPVYEIRTAVEPAPVKPVSNGPEIPVQPVQFAPIQPNYNPKEVGNIDLIMDVPLQITVELGRSKKTIREILALGQGSVIELDKLAGEPVDLLVNGKLLAKGEVVVIDENFGIRVSDIISPIERVTNLQ